MFLFSINYHAITLPTEGLRVCEASTTLYPQSLTVTKTYRSFFFLLLITNSTVKNAHANPDVKNTPAKLNAENTGLKMMGGRN